MSAMRQWVTLRTVSPWIFRPRSRRRSNVRTMLPSREFSAGTRPRSASPLSTVSKTSFRYGLGTGWAFSPKCWMMASSL